MKTSGAKNAHAGEGSVRAFRKKRMLEVVPNASAEVAGERASGSGVLVFSIAVFLVSLCVVMGLSSLLFGEVGLVAIVCSFAVAMLGDDVGPHRSAMGARGGSPIRKIQSRFGPWLVLDYSHHRAERYAGGHENQVDDIWRGGDSHFRSCPHQCERCSVLDGVGCEGGLYRGGRLLPRG